MRKLTPLLVALLLLASSLVPATVGAAKPISDVKVKETGTNFNNGQALPFGQGEKLNGQPPLGPAKTGQSRTWLALDDGDGTAAHPSRIYLKNYTLRGVGQHVEVWVANDLSFQAGDCRNNLLNGVNRVAITDAQVAYLIDEFDNNMYPIESAWWGVPPDRNGHKAVLPTLFPSLPSAAYKGEGDNIVVLVDNVRDANYWDLNNTQTHSYIAGFFWSVFNDYFNRNVMSIDAFDWTHRTTADPPHEPTTDPCTSAPARPFLYESVFAHEYQHLIHHYSDPDEDTWVNEGMSDFTEIITGYLDTSKHVSEKGNDSHTNSFLGWYSVAHPSWNPIPRASGPENGLIAWEDQGADEILEDYGFALYFMNLVFSQGFGQEFFHAWHNGDENGIAGLETQLTGAGSSDTFASLFRDVITSALVDGYIDNGATVTGAAAADLQNVNSEATIFFSPEAYSTPGAPPWGGDFIPLGAGGSLSSVVFDGADQFVFPAGPEWVVDANGYWTNPDVAGQFYYDNNQDLSIARSITVTGAGNLTFDHYYGMELGWDYGFVQVSTDGGSTWTSLPCTGTTDAHDPGAISSIVAHLPGYTGPSGNDLDPATTGSASAPVAASCNLSAYSGVGPILLGLRLMTDPGFQQDGWHVRNLMLDGTAVDATPADLSDWDNIQFFDELALSFYLTVVGTTGTVDAWGDVTAGSSVVVLRPTLGAGNAYTLSAADLAALAGSGQVVAIVSGVPDDEYSTLYHPYSLLVNGVQKADGG